MENEHSSMVKSDQNYTNIAYKKPNDYCTKLTKLSAMVSPLIKHEVVEVQRTSKYGIVPKSRNSQVPIKSTVNKSTGYTSANNINSNNSDNIPKMGSRRIFTPQFKLQVLESYRNDSDCKGNQRATARKYNIHRRQIQKWLQCESNLRSSVANINQTNIKHQFHNISHHHLHQQTQQLQHMTVASANSNCKFRYNKPNNVHHHHQHQLSLDVTRQSVSLNSLIVPSLPMGVPSTTASAQEAISAANLAAVVAAAGASGAIAIANTTTTNTSTTVSPIRPKAIGGSSSVTMSQSLLHPHQQHLRYPIAYTHTPASVPASMPTVTDHIPPQHLHHQYQFNNLSSHTLPQTQQSSAFLPSTCLPVTVLSAAAVTTTTTASTATTAISALELEGIAELWKESRQGDELHQSIKATRTSTAALTANKYVCRNEHAYSCYENMDDINQESNYMGVQQYFYMQQPAPVCWTVMPMDLSLGSRRNNMPHRHSDLVELPAKVHVAKCSKKSPTFITNDNSVVDLTFRKRKLIITNAVNDEDAAKLAKLSDSSTESDSISAIKVELEENDALKENSDESTEVNGDLKIEEKSSESKPVKLFKPYLLDETVHNADDVQKSNVKYSKISPTEQCEPIIWSNHPVCSSPQNYESFQDNSRVGIFQKQTFPDGSSDFHGSKPTSPQSSLSLTAAPAFCPTSFCCPKGSPVSGYESSSSTYSESSYTGEPFSITNKRTYRIDLQMQTVQNDNIVQQNHLQRWLDQDMTNPPAATTSIALYA